MSLSEFLTSNWSLAPWALILGASLSALYVIGAGYRLEKKSILFFSGVAIIIFSLVSPLDHLGRYYLFSAHMIQHILLLLVAPLLMVLGLGETNTGKLLNTPVIGKTLRKLTNPLLAWALGVGWMWIWHMPSLYEKALSSEVLYVSQQVSFILIGMIFWWPVFGSAQSRRLSPLTSTLYLSSACLACSILGMLITFAGAGLYPAYLNPADAAGILPYIRNELCITPGADQQIGGLTMWVPGCMIYLAASIVTLVIWYSGDDEELERLLRGTDSARQTR